MNSFLFGTHKLTFLQVIETIVKHKWIIFYYTISIVDKFSSYIIMIMNKNRTQVTEIYNETAEKNLGPEDREAERLKLRMGNIKLRTKKSKEKQELTKGKM